MRRRYLRKQLRLKNYDYSQEGAYYVTVCAQNRECLFGNVCAGIMNLNEYGEIVKHEWGKTGDIRKNIELDEFIVIPNHIHGIINIVRRGVLQYAPTNKFKSPSQTLGAIIRDEKDLNRIREYIINNSQRWQNDKLYNNDNFDNR